MTRHGVADDGSAVDDPKRDREAEEITIMTMPEHERAGARERLDMMWERWKWEGDQWPRPRPGANPRNVAIVGFAGSRLVAPYGQEGWELWSLNDPHEAPGIPMRHAFTRWFQLHPPRYLGKHYKRGIKDLARHWSEPTGLRLYMDQHYPEFPDSEPYPYDEVMKLAGHAWYHASSFDWMLALAILEGFERISVYGCDFYAYPVMNGEPISALPALMYWCGVAEGRGIKLDVIGGGHLFRILHLAAYESGLQYGWDREPALDLGTDIDRQWRDVR